MEKLYKCERCRGRGIISTKRKDRGLRACPVCNGKRELNWIDNIFKKEENEPVMIRTLFPIPNHIQDILDAFKKELYVETCSGKSLDRFAKLYGIPSRYLKGKSEQNKKNIIMKGIKNG